jgi:hypothetical protein
MARRNLLLLAAVLAFCGTVLFLGCSSDEINSPAPIEDGSGLSSSMRSLPAGAPSGTSEMVISKVIDKTEGGFIRNDGIRLVFEPYALEDNTEITIIKHPADGDKVLFELLPHGIEFRKGVDLTVNLRDCDIRPDEVGTIYWWDPERETWVDLKASWCYPNATVKLDHFSRYGGGRAGW